MSAEFGMLAHVAGPSRATIITQAGCELALHTFVSDNCADKAEDPDAAAFLEELRGSCANIGVEQSVSGS